MPVEIERHFMAGQGAAREYGSYPARVTATRWLALYRPHPSGIKTAGWAVKRRDLQLTR
jgi:hypothetical protein